MSEQGKCLVRIEERMKNDYKVIGKIDKKLDHLVDGNSSPGIPTRVNILEVGQNRMKEDVRKTNKLLWAILILVMGGLLTGFLTNYGSGSDSKISTSIRENP